MQKAIEKVNEWQQNMQSPEYQAFLDELSAHGHSAVMTPATRTVRTNQYTMVLPTFLDVTNKMKELKLERNELLLDYTFVIKQSVFGDRNDVEANEKYEMLAKRLTDIKNDIITLERYSALVGGGELAMIHPPQMLLINKAKKGRSLKGGAIDVIIPPHIPSVAESVLVKVKQLLKTNFGKKTEVPVQN